MILHFDGRAWREVEPPAELSAPGQLGVRSVSGTAADDVWFTNGWLGLLRWDGRGLAQVKLPHSYDFVEAVWAAARDDVWAVGSSDYTCLIQTLG